MSSLPEMIDQTIRARGLFRRGRKILVAVSGGVDSMVLLHVLHQLSKKYKWQITVAHLNHRLRGRSSDADERLVGRAAKALRLPVVIERANVKARAKTGRLSLEMAAREARHEFLARTAARLRIPSIALAHHADDQVELFFVRVFRGSGSEGLAGMKWRNRAPFGPTGTKIELVRPFLEQSKNSLREYARQQKIKSREDASNQSVDILRNRIRHELLPLLRRKYQPGLDRIILRLMDITGGENEFNEEVAQEWLASWKKDGVSNLEGNLPLSPGRLFPTNPGTSNVQHRTSNIERGSPRSPERLLTPALSSTSRRRGGKKRALSLASHFAHLPLAIQRRVLQLELRRHKIPVDFALVEQLRLRPGEPVTISPQIAVFRDGKGMLQLREPLRIESNSDQLAVELRGREGNAVLDDKAVQWQIVRQRTFEIPSPRTGREIFDADKVGARITLRHWRPGDRFQPIGMAQSVKLQDLFANNRVPRAKRHEALVAVTAENELFWVEGLRISERFKLTSETKQQLIWNWNPR